MSVLFEGNCLGKAVGVEIGGDAEGKPRVRWEMEVVDGAHVGKRARYSGKLDRKNIKFTKADMVAIGWKGKDVRTFVDDVKSANLTIQFIAEIAEYGGRQWTSAKIGGAVPLSSLPAREVDEVNKWFGEADDAEDKIPF